MDYDSGDGERYRRRLRKQRKYQADHRIGQRENGVPERDDVASATLRMMLGSAAANPDAANGWIPRVAGDLAASKKKFDAGAAERTIRAMVKRHAQKLEKKRRQERR